MTTGPGTTVPGLFCFMIHGFDWTHTPSEEDLERDNKAPDRFKYWQKFQYVRTAKKFGAVVHTEIITVYARTEHVFNEILKHWNALGNTPLPLNPGLSWHYAPASESGLNSN